MKNNWATTATEEELIQVGKESMELINQWFKDIGIDFRYEWDNHYYEVAKQKGEACDAADTYLAHGHGVSRDFGNVFVQEEAMGNIGGNMLRESMVQHGMWKHSAAHWYNISVISPEYYGKTGKMGIA